MELKPDTTVLVTGGSGYVAGWMIVELLRRGLRVRTTVRSASKEAPLRAAVATQVDPADRLTVHLADLTRDEGWDAAVSGCRHVIHVASPMGQGMGRNVDLLGPARAGSLRVLEAAARAGVERVVTTSSVVASMTVHAGDEAEPADESVWTDPARPGVDNYSRSKTLAERAIWDFVERRAATGSGGLSVTTILPGLILGPVMTGSVSGSVELVERLLNGRMPAIPRIGFSLVDVRDLVDLHLRAMVAPAAANERFLAAPEHLWLAEIAAILRERLGTRAKKVPTRVMPDLVVRLAALVREDARFLAPRLRERREFSSVKARALLGWEPRPAARTLEDTAESLFAHALA